DEIRQITDRLYNPLKYHIAQFIKQQRQDDRGRKAPDQRVQANQYRIAQQYYKIRIVDNEHLEVLEAYPITRPYACERIVILKGHYDSEHGTILEDQIV